MVSVVLAAYNAANTVEQTLLSILSQEDVDVEIVLCDGGSSDGTVDIVRRFDARIAYWESAPDRGIYHAWNKALRKVRGRWICFLGCDDRFASARSLANLVKWAEAGPYDFVSGRVCIVPGGGNSEQLYGAAWSWQQMKRHQVVAHPGALHARSLFDRFGGFDERYAIAADYEFMLRVGPGLVADFLDEIVVDMGWNGVSRARYMEAIWERTRIQAAHPEIGLLRASWNGGLTLLKVLLNRATGRA